MAVERVFDLAPGDRDAAGVYDVLHAVHDVEVAAFVQVAEVAGVEPAAREGFLGLLGFLPVADRQVRGAVDDLAGLAHRRVVHLRVHHAGLDVEGRPSGGGQKALPVLLGPQDGGQGRDPALPVAVVQPGVGEPLAQLLKHRHGHDGGPVLQLP